MKLCCSFLILILLLTSCSFRGPAFREQLQMDAINAITMLSFGQPITEIPRDRLETWMIRFGKAFGPKGIRHFSELSPEEKTALLERVPILKTNHSDWPAPLRWVPRTFSAWVGGERPERKHILEGFDTVTDASFKADGTLLPIPKCGDSYVMDGYMASTLPLASDSSICIHNRIGWRYDDVDDYWDLSFALKEVPR